MHSLGSLTWRAPVVQFLALGLVLYFALDLSGRDSSVGLDPRSAEFSRKIVVERDALLAFVQARTQEPDARVTALAYDGLTRERRQHWIDRFVREEALVREALSLGLDRGDELIRRRLVQKLEFLTLGVVEDEEAIGEADVEAFYHAHVEEYRVPTILTFAHVFFRGGGDSGPPAEAMEVLEGLNEKGAGLSGALPLGDRFLYNRHYVDRTLDEVRSHFGDAMSGALAKITPDPERWQGPIASDHGWHLVLVSVREESRLPKVGEIAASLRRDLLREKSEGALEAGLREVVFGYEVELGPGLE